METKKPKTSLIRSHVVEDTYEISPSKRKELTRSGVFSSFKLGNTLYYDQTQIEEVIRKNQIS